MTIFCEDAIERNQPLWAAAIGFRKAFATIDRAVMIETLLGQGVEHRYVEFIWKLYSPQVATVKRSQPSGQFQTRRGTTQGDSISSALFNAILQKQFHQRNRNGNKQVGE